MVLSVPAGLGQSTVSIGNGGGVVVGGVAGGIAFTGGPQGITGMPYTATRKTTHVQKLADGTTITRENTAKEARDSNGRTYHENRMDLPSGAAGQAGFSFVNVVDPVNRVTMNWNSSSKQVTVFHMPEPGQVRQAQQPSPLTPPQPSAMKVVQTKPQFEDLGIKAINGIEARGTRMTRVIEAGKEGNDRPMTITNETWFSPDLKITVASTNDDPRTGTTTMELTNIDRGEPDSALFQVPEGYTVKDQYPGQQN
jgi:hypothetical protein